MVPFFRMGLDLKAIGATATSLFTIIPTSIAGCITHLRNKTCIPTIGLVAGFAGACTSPAGVWLANQSPSFAIMAATACVIIYSASTMLYKFFKNRPVQSLNNNSTNEEKNFKIRPALFFKTVLIGISAGVASGYVGVGGGFLMVPLFDVVLGLPMKKASGTSLLAVCILAIPGVIVQAMLGNIDYLAGIAMALGSIPGAMIGGNLIKRVPERTLRLIFALFLLIVAISLIANEFLF